jgi:hypothetical protein
VNEDITAAGQTILGSKTQALNVKPLALLHLVISLASLVSVLTLLPTILAELYPLLMPMHSCTAGPSTDKKENKIFPICKEIQSGAVAKSYTV